MEFTDGTLREHFFFFFSFYFFKKNNNFESNQLQKRTLQIPLFLSDLRPARVPLLPRGTNWERRGRPAPCWQTTSQNPPWDPGRDL